MFRLKLKSVLLSSLMVAFLSSCNVMGVLKNQKNLVGRYYDGALNEKELKKFNPALAKAYLVANKETDFKKPYIIGKCIADSIVSHLPKNSYQSFADWQILITASDRVSISAIGNRLLLISQGAMEYFEYDQNVIAFFIAHAVAHSELDHLNERMGMKQYSVSNPLEAFQQNTGNYVSTVMALAGDPLNEKDMVLYSMDMEQEADNMAMTLHAVSGYDPNNLFIYLNNHIDDDQVFYLKQHPITQKRVDYLATLLDNSVGLRDHAHKLGVHPQCSNTQ